MDFRPHVSPGRNQTLKQGCSFIWGLECSLLSSVFGRNQSLIATCLRSLFSCYQLLETTDPPPTRRTWQSTSSFRPTKEHLSDTAFFKELVWLDQAHPVYYSFWLPQNQLITSQSPEWYLIIFTVLPTLKEGVFYNLFTPEGGNLGAILDFCLIHWAKLRRFCIEQVEHYVLSRSGD